MLRNRDCFKHFNLVNLIEERFDWKGPELNTSVGMRFRDRITEIKVDGKKTHVDYNSKEMGIIGALRKNMEIVKKVVSQEEDVEAKTYVNIISLSLDELRRIREQTHQLKSVILNRMKENKGNEK